MANILEMEDNLLTEMKKNDYLHDNTIYFDTEVDRESQVKVCRMMRKIAEKELSKPVEKRKPIKIRISSFGGSILAYFAIASCMQEIKEKGNEQFKLNNYLLAIDYYNKAISNSFIYS